VDWKERVPRLFWMKDEVREKEKPSSRLLA
jgi:hypothetical protein